MSQDLDVGTLTLLIVVGYWYWRICRTIGNPPADLKSDEARRNAPILPVAKRSSALRPPAHDGARFNWPTKRGSAGAEALASIRIADRNFDAVLFLRGAVRAYESILTAFAESNLSVLDNLTSAEVYDLFVVAIRGQEGASQEWILQGIDDATIVGATMEGVFASITVSFSSRFMISGRLGTSGGPDETEEEIVAVTDKWTFARAARSADPNWKLVATGSE